MPETGENVTSKTEGTEGGAGQQGEQQKNDGGSVDWGAFGKELEDQGLSPDKVKERLTHARTWEQRAKDNKGAADELEKLRKSQMSEQDKAVEEAKAAGRKEAAAQFGQKLAAAKLEAGLTGVVKNPEALVEDLNLAKFVTDDGDVDSEAVKAFIAKHADGKRPPDLKQGEQGSNGGGSVDGNEWMRQKARA